MKLTYTNVNGYLIPNLTYKSGEQMEQLGKYGLIVKLEGDFMAIRSIEYLQSLVRELAKLPDLCINVVFVRNEAVVMIRLLKQPVKMSCLLRELKIRITNSQKQYCLQKYHLN